MDKNLVEFSDVIAALLDNSVPFPPKLLYNLSGIHSTEYTELAAAWQLIAIERRRALLQDLDELADNDFLLDFDNIGRIALHDPDPEVCINAISLLWQAEDKKLVPEFIRFMQTHKNEAVRAAAAGALGPYVYLGEVEKLPEKLLHELEEALLKTCETDGSLQVRRRSLESLGYSSRDEVSELINKAMRSTDTLWLESGLCAMGRSADNSYDRKVAAFLDNDAPEVQLAAVHAAGELGVERARVRLLEFLAEGMEDAELRAEVIWALSQIGGEGVEDALEDLLDNTEDPDEIDLIEEALDNLSFTEDDTDFDLIDFDLDEDDLDEDDFDFDDEDDDENY